MNKMVGETTWVLLGKTRDIFKDSLEWFYTLGETTKGLHFLREISITVEEQIREELDAL